MLKVKIQQFKYIFQSHLTETIMNSWNMNLTLATGAALLGLSLTSFAQTNGGAAQPAATSEVEPPVAAFVTKAELALTYSGLFGVIRKKNVKTVTNPDTGVFCIESSVPLNLKRIYPLVSIEWGYSLGSALLAFWRDTTNSTDCPSGWLEVQTFDFNTGGAPVATQGVAFDLVIE
jgi:hypothetical protein